ncbi:hypothetical protein V5799_014609, partial [Amblyomma americanum]
MMTSSNDKIMDELSRIEARIRKVEVLMSRKVERPAVRGKWRSNVMKQLPILPSILACGWLICGKLNCQQPCSFGFWCEGRLPEVCSRAVYGPSKNAITSVSKLDNWCTMDSATPAISCQVQGTKKSPWHVRSSDQLFC